MMNSAVNTMSFVSEMMNFVSEMMNFVSEMMNFVLKMPDFGADPRACFPQRWQ